MIISKILLALSTVVAVLTAFMYDADTITLKAAVTAMAICYITVTMSFLAIKRLAKSGRTKRAHTKLFKRILTRNFKEVKYENF